MKKVVTVVGKNGVEYTVALTAEEAHSYVQLAQAQASSVEDVMKKFSEYVIRKSQQDARQTRASSIADMMHDSRELLVSEDQQDTAHKKDQYN